MIRRNRGVAIYSRAAIATLMPERRAAVKEAGPIYATPGNLCGGVLVSSVAVHRVF